MNKETNIEYASACLYSFIKYMIKMGVSKDDIIDLVSSTYDIIFNE